MHNLLRDSFQQRNRKIPQEILNPHLSAVEEFAGEQMRPPAAPASSTVVEAAFPPRRAFHRGATTATASPRR
jgi:hypothetical protein